jgi:hypothetical protein
MAEKGTGARLGLFDAGSGFAGAFGLGLALALGLAEGFALGEYFGTGLFSGEGVGAGVGLIEGEAFGIGENDGARAGLGAGRKGKGSLMPLSGFVFGRARATIASGVFEGLGPPVTVGEVEGEGDAAELVAVPAGFFPATLWQE